MDKNNAESSDDPDYLGGIIVAMAMFTALWTSHVLPGGVEPSLAGLAVNYTLLVPIYLNWVVKFIAECEMYMGAVERVYQILELPREESDYSVTVMPGPLRGEITFRNVTLRYSETNEPVFQNFDLHIPAGQKVGICGRTGSGKSTLIMSIFRLLDPTSGVLLLDGVDLSTIPPSLARSHIAIVPQDAAIFPGSVRENLDPMNTLPDSDLLRALTAVGLGELPLDGDFSNFPLSTGQRQLLCLARALLRPACVLIMDEASSSLDKKAEDLLLSAAFETFKGKTIIVIAHRLQTLLGCDRILVLDRGRIAEDGTPEKLRSKQMGLFATMLRSSENVGF